MSLNISQGICWASGQDSVVGIVTGYGWEESKKTMDYTGND